MSNFIFPKKEEDQKENMANNNPSNNSTTNQAGGTSTSTINATSPPANPKPAKPSQAEELVVLANSEFSFFHSPEQDGFAKIIVKDCKMVMPLRSDQFKKLLGLKYNQVHHKVPNRQSLDDAVQLLIGKATFEGPEEEVFIRTAPYNDGIIVDLSNNQGQAVEINSTGWRIIKNPSVNFIRLKSQQPMPSPLPGGTLNDFRPFINTETEEDFIMSVSFLTFSLHPKGPYPVLVLNGGGGSCKSTSAHMMKSIVDPSLAVNFSKPKNLQNVFVNAANTWLVSYDNLSHIEPWFSDALCQLATGGSHGAKKLYTDGDEFQIIVKRPIIIDGIGELIVRGDLARRSINVSMKNIEGTLKLKTEEQIWTEFFLKQPYLLGWIFDAMSSGLRNLHLVNENYSTMADFCRFIAAADKEIWTPGTFNSAYRSNISRVTTQVIQSNPVASCVIALMQNETDCKGTATEALHALAHFIHDKRILSSSDLWPQYPNKLRGFLEQSANLLRQEGIEIQFDIFENGKRLMRIYKTNIAIPKSVHGLDLDTKLSISNIKLIEDSKVDVSATKDLSDNGYAPNTDESPKPVFEDLGVTPDGKYWQMRNETGLIKLKIESKKQEDKPEEINEIDEKYMYQSVFPDED